MTDSQRSLGDVLTNLPAVRAAKKIKTLGPVHRRLIAPLDDSEQGRELAYQHTVFCQTGLPYRNPGDDVRQWQRVQGTTMLVVQAGQVLRPREGKALDVGLPWGTKPRLILAHLNAEAIKKFADVTTASPSASPCVIST